jgi:hypothetical protein
MHFFNIYIFSKMRDRGFITNSPEPTDEFGDTLRASKTAANAAC